MNRIKKIMQWFQELREFRDFRGKGTYPLSSPYLTKLLTWAAGEEKELTKPYIQHPVFYAGVRAKARNVAQVPLLLYHRGSDKVFENENHPVVKLLNSVNPFMSKYQLKESIVTCLDIFGEAMVVKDRETAQGGVPVFLWPRNPDEFVPQFRGQEFVAWEWSTNGMKIYLYPDEVIQFKYYNPYDQIRGLSPVKALETGLAADWAAIKYNKRFFDNDGTPGAVFSTEQQLSDAQYDRLKHDLINSRKGVDHAFRAMLLDGGVKLSNTPPNNRDMQFLENRKFSREEIAMILGVPKPELQLYEDINYATSRSADLSFWKKTLIPLMTLIEDKLNQDLLNPLGFEASFDTRSIDVLNEDLIQKADAASKFWSMGVPFNVINERLDLGFPPVPGGDEPRQQGFALPPEKQKALDIPVRGDLAPKQIDGALATKEARGVVWKSKLQPILPIIGRCNKAVKNYMFDVEQKILKAYAKALPAWVTKDEQNDFEDIDDFFNDERLRAALQGPLDDAMRVALRDYDYPTDDTKAILARRMNNIKGINDTARAAVKEKLKGVLEDALKYGWNERERAEAVFAAIRDSMKANKTRARTIARTEVHGAFSEGLWQGTKIAAPKKIMWISSRDERVRDSHADLDGMKVSPGERFPNGLEYPMDPAGDAGEVINCRCTYIDIFEE